MTRTPILGIAAGLLVALLLLAPADTVRAHANFLRSEPPANSVLDAPPEQVQLWFTEPLESGFSQVQVLDPQGKQVDHGDSRVLAADATSMIVTLPALERGAYTLSWRALSKVDGHVTRGVFSLSIGVAPPTAAGIALPQEWAVYVPLEAAIRWLSYLSVAALVGPLLFRLLVLAPVAARLGWSGSVLTSGFPLLKRLLWWAWAWLLLSICAMLAFQVALLGGAGEGASPFSTVGQLLFGTRYGAVWLARLGLVLGLGGILPRIRQDSGAKNLWVGVALGGAILLTFSLNSHSAAVAELTLLAVLADWLHLAAIATWVGGLLALAMLLPSNLSPLPPAERLRFLASVIPRFSAIASLCVATLIITGVYQAWLHLGSLGALVETFYGRSLVAKLGLVAPLLLLGALTLLVIRPRLAEVAASAGALLRAERLSRRFSRTVLAEAILATLVLVAAGVLTSLPPGRQTYAEIQASRPLELSAVAQDLGVSLTISPARPGPSTFTASLQDAGGRSVEDAELVLLTFIYLDQALGSSAERADPQGDGRYVLRGPFIGVAGRWQVELLARRAGRDDARTAFRILITATSAQEERPGASMSDAAAPRAGALSLAGLGLTLMGLGLVIYLMRTVGLRSPTGQSLVLVSLMVVGLGVFLTLRTPPASVPADLRAVTNPFPPTQDSLMVGERIYRTQCQVCHGVTGRGDGPAAPTLSPRPADFRVHMAAGHTDGELFTWVSNGVPGTAMPAFGDKLTPEERWHAINFIRSFAPVESKAIDSNTALVNAAP